MRKPIYAALVVALVVATSAAVIPRGTAVAGSDSRVSFGKCVDDALAAAGADCATLSVPIDYGRPDGEKISIAISRIKGRGDHRGILLSNPGGPGEPGLEFPLELKPILGTVADHYDLIGFDPRFVGQSSPITCGHASLADLLQSAGLDRAGFRRSVTAAEDFAKRCHARNAEVLPYAGYPEVAADMDSIRAALAAPSLAYYGVSYGTVLGAVYSQLFPGHVGRMVLDSSLNSPLRSDYEFLRGTTDAAETALDEWAAWTAWRDRRYGLGRTGTAVRASLRQLNADLAAHPVAIAGHRVDDNNLPLLLRSWLSDESSNAVLADAVRQLREAVAGRTVVPSRSLADGLTELDARGPFIDNAMAASMAVRCSDGGWPTNPEHYWRDIQRHRTDQPIYGAMYRNINACAFWREVAGPGPRIRNNVKMLMVQGLRDAITPLAGALQLHRRLAGSRLLTADVRTHGVYLRGAERNAAVPCVINAVNGYLRTGDLAAHDASCR